MTKIGPFELDSIVCGNSYELIKQIPDKSVDLIYTDIPYLYNQGGSGTSELGERTAKKRLALMGMSDVFEKYNCSTQGKALKLAKQLVKGDIEVNSIEDGIDYAILDEFVRVMKKINIFIWCSKLQILDIMKFFIEKHGCYFEILCWCKTNPTPSTNNSWLPDIEYCLYFREKGVPLNDGYENKSKFYVSPANVKDKDHFSHPTCKPTNIIDKHIRHSTKEGDIILDPFAGSCSTCVSAKNNKRHYIAFEIEKKWVDIGNSRLDNIDANGQMSFITF